jgi:hypothetical protein
MKKLSLLFPALFLALFAHSQSGTMQYSGGKSTDKAAVLIVPFEPFMYISEIDQQVGAENKMDGKEVKDAFAKALDMYFYQQFNEQYQVLSFYFMEDDVEQDLTYIYTSRKLKYEVIPEEEASKNEEKLKGIQSKLSKSFKKEEDESTYGGQIVTKREVENKFMNANISDKKVLDSLNRRYNASLYLLINQLEFRNLYGDFTQMEGNTYDRIAKVHYTLYSKRGTVVSKGLATTPFPSANNNIESITSTYFPILAEQIFKAVNMDVASTKN